MNDLHQRIAKGLIKKCGPLRLQCPKCGQSKSLTEKQIANYLVVGWASCPDCKCETHLRMELEKAKELVRGK